MKKSLSAAIAIGFSVFCFGSGTAYAELSGDAKIVWDSISEGERLSNCGRENRDARREISKAYTNANVRGGRREVRREVRRHWGDYCRSQRGSWKKKK